MIRSTTEDERRYFEMTSQQRWTMAALYFGLVAFLGVAMRATHVMPPTQAGAP
jgi:hypothetical protein